MTLHIPFQGNTTRSHKEYLFLFYPTVQIIFVFSKSTDAHPRQDVLPDKFWREYIYRNKNGGLICYDWKCIWVLVPIGCSIRLFKYYIYLKYVFSGFGRLITHGAINWAHALYFWYQRWQTHDWVLFIVKLHWMNDFTDWFLQNEKWNSVVRSGATHGENDHF